MTWGLTATAFQFYIYFQYLPSVCSFTDGVGKKKRMSKSCFGGNKRRCGVALDKLPLCFVSGRKHTRVCFLRLSTDKLAQSNLIHPFWKATTVPIYSIRRRRRLDRSWQEVKTYRLQPFRGGGGGLAGGNKKSTGTFLPSTRRRSHLRRNSSCLARLPSVCVRECVRVLAARPLDRGCV